MNLLELAQAYAVVAAKHAYYVRRIALTKNHLKVDRGVLREFGQKRISSENAERLRRQIRVLTRGMKRWKRRVAQLDRLKVPMEHILRGQVTTKMSPERIGRLWPRWMGRDGKIKAPQSYG